MKHAKRDTATALAHLPDGGALIEQLRRLAQIHPEDAKVRSWLAAGLFVVLNDAEAEEDLERRDACLEELRGFARAHPNDAFVREGLERAEEPRRNDGQD